jgi:hypothetical protein
MSNLSEAPTICTISVPDRVPKIFQCQALDLGNHEGRTPCEALVAKAIEELSNLPRWCAVQVLMNLVWSETSDCYGWCTTKGAGTAAKQLGKLLSGLFVHFICSSPSSGIFFVVANGGAYSYIFLYTEFHSLSPFPHNNKIPWQLIPKHAPLAPLSATSLQVDIF